jgi:hypothetical protein
VIQRESEPKASPASASATPADTAKDDSPRKPMILATNKLDDRFDASAVIVGHQILLRGNENLYCISAD